MKAYLCWVVTGLMEICIAEEVSSASHTTDAAHDARHKWSMVFLPDLEWSDTEAKLALRLLDDLKPALVVSLSPCPFADGLRGLPNKPQVLHQAQRVARGVSCGLPDVPHAAHVDTSTLHAFADKDGEGASLVWLSASVSKVPFNGPKRDADEQRALARMQVREQLSKQRGEVVFLIDPEHPVPDEADWQLPREHVRYAQAASAVTGIACIRPDFLLSEVPAIDGFSPRVPVVHWIHSNGETMEWDVLPVDGGPALQHAKDMSTSTLDERLPMKIRRIHAPRAGSEVPLWMDDYVNGNAALGTGDTEPRGAMTRRYAWKPMGVTREPFRVLNADLKPAQPAEPKELERGTVRSPRKIFSVTVGQMDERGWYPAGGDDGFNVYLDDRRNHTQRLLHFCGLYDAWPAAATWFTDRYMITCGTGAGAYEWDDENAFQMSTRRPQTMHLFDLQTGKAYVTASHAEAAGPSHTPTERIFFPCGSSYECERRWKMLWEAVEAGYRIQPMEAPMTLAQVAGLLKWPVDAAWGWQDLGVWPRPENWRLVPVARAEDHGLAGVKFQNGGDPFLSYTESGHGQRQYRIAISGWRGMHFDAQQAQAEIYAYAEIFTTGGGRLRRLETIRRVGDQDRLLVLAGTYEKPAGGRAAWLLMIDLLHGRAWSAHG
jgi:hypothetical protein